MKLLCAADLHLGRVPSRLPSGLPIDDAELGPAAAWRALVDTCIEERPDALLLAGDLIDDERDLFGAYSDLDAGLRRLEQAGVPVVAVAGNHDVRTLPQLAGALPHLTLLGRGGRWEAHELGTGNDRIRIVGWSFPREHVPDTPLDAPGAAILRDDRGTTIGLLHADLDATAGGYAPVRRSRLAATPVDAWLLGHVHVPSAFADGDRIGYLGSLAATDPGEEGPRGAWMLHVENEGLRFEPISLAPLRYRSLTVDLSGVEPDEAPANLLRRLRSAVFDAEAARVTAIRLTVTGRVDDPAGIRDVLAAGREDGWLLEDGTRTAFVHRLDVGVRAAYDLDRLAALDDPVGVAARLLQQVRDPDAPGRAEMLADAGERLDEVARRTPFRPLDLDALTDADVAALVERSSERVLDALLLSRERGEP